LEELETMAATGEKAASIEIDALGASISDTVEQAVRRGQRVELTRGGAPIATIVSEQEIAELDRLRWNAAFDAFARISDAFRDVPLDELEREIERAAAEVRAETREETRSRRGT
jgi:antitoxin (DNA-binding transcriptional repressor) of toxin-antitoxin stability system